MAGVTFDEEVGGDGSTVTDDDNAVTGLRKSGYLVRFAPALQQFVAIALWTKNYIVASLATMAGYLADATAQAAAAAASVASINVAFTGTSTTAESPGYGAKGPFTVLAGKAWNGARLRFASDDFSKIMDGNVTSYVGTAITIDCDYFEGAGSHNDWNISVIGEPGPAGPGGSLTSGGDIANTAIDGIKRLTMYQELDAGVSGASKTIVMADAQNHKITMSANCALTLDWTGAGIGKYQLKIVQDGVTARTITLTGVLTTNWANSTGQPPLNTVLGSETIWNFYHDGTKAIGGSSKIGAV